MAVRYFLSTVVFIISGLLGSLEFLPVSFLSGAFFGLALGVLLLPRLEHKFSQVFALGVVGYLVLIACYYMGIGITQLIWEHVGQTAYALLAMLPAGLAAVLMYSSLAWQLRKKTRWGVMLLLFFVGYVAAYAETQDYIVYNQLPDFFNNHPALNLVWQVVVGNLLLVVNE